jgi:anti-sigma-K factor RskA
MTGHDQWKDEVAAYVLGTLSPAETAELDRHLAECDICRRELRWLRPAVDSLGESVERVEPSPDLRLNVMAAVREDLERANPVPERRPLLGGLFTGWRPAAALAAVALIAAAVAGYAIRDSGSEAPETTTVSAGKAPGVTAKMVAEGHSGTLELAHVGRMPEDRVLEAWVQRDGAVEPVRALFVPDSSGHATTTIPDTQGVEAVMVTKEPRGGSESPTLPAMVTLEMPE